MDEPELFSLDSVIIDITLPLAELLRSVERQIVKAPVEVGFAFDQAGNLLARQVGQVSSLRFYADDMRVMRDAILTHNHPGSGFFSYADIAFACYVNLWEIRAVAGRRVYRLSRPSGGWNFDDFKAAFESGRRKILHSYQQRSISRHEANSRMNNLVRVTVKQVSLPLQEDKL
jgi:hypothetical protein